MSLERIKQYYNETPETDRLLSPHGRLEYLRTKQILQRILPSHPIKILDVGGAVGVYSFWLAQLGHAVWLVDPSEAHIQIAKERNKSEKNKLQAIVLGQVEHLEFEDRFFDIVLNMGPLYHLQEPYRRTSSLIELKRTLKEDGIL